MGTPATPALEQVGRALSESAAAHDREYISTTAWELEFMPDKHHLTVAGHAAFAGLVADHLR